MTFPYSQNPTDWQTAYTRDDAYRSFGKYARHFENVFFGGVVIIAGFIAIRSFPVVAQLISRYLGKLAMLPRVSVSILITFLLAFLVAYVGLQMIRSKAFGFAKLFFTDFYLPPESVEPGRVIQYRLYGKFKLPPPFTMFIQFKYIMAKDGGFARADQWPVWMARTLGGPLILIVFDGCALYVERGNRFSRIIGPGDKVPFLEWYETVKYVVDLRPKVHEAKFDAWTKDGIKIEIKARIECRIGDPKKKDPEGKLVFPYDPIAVKQAVERYALRWPTCPEGEPSEFTWIDAAWGQVTGIVPGYIGSRMLDDLFIANRNGGQILSPDAVQDIFTKLNSATNGFGVYVTDFQVLETILPEAVEKHQKEYWMAEKQSVAKIADGRTKAFRIREQEEARADAQYDMILELAKGLNKNQNGRFVEPILLSFARVLDQSLQDPLMRAYLAKETLDTLEQLQEILGHRLENNDDGNSTAQIGSAIKTIRD